MRSVALIGPDGAGKSTIAREVVGALPVPARYLYMGVNVDSSTRLLPTTRLAFALKRGRGRRHMTPGEPSEVKRRGGAGVLSEAYASVRLLAWLAEEWYRATLAFVYVRRGYLVVFDRHFVYDYYATHIVRRPGRSITTRLHGELLRRVYPRPDLVVCLDAPAELLHARKREQSVAWLEGRRQEYLAMAKISRDFAVVDATQPMPAVVAEIRGLIVARLEQDAGG